MLGEAGEGAPGLLTVERGVHAPDVDQQAHHGHVDCSRALRQQLVFEDLAALAAFCHGIQIDVCKGMATGRVGLLGEDALVILEHELEEVVLNVLAPQRDTVVLFEMLDLVAAVDGRNAPIRIAAGSRRCCRVVCARRVVVGGGLRRLGRITASLALVGDRRRALRGRGLGVVHLGVGGQNVP